MHERLDLTPEQNKELTNISGIRIARQTKSKAICYCPYHTDKKHPSLHINYKRGTFHCWTCGASGTIPRLVYDQTGHGASYYLKDSLQQPAEAFSFAKMDDIHSFMRLGSIYCENQVETTLQMFREARPPSLIGTPLPWQMSSDAREWVVSRHIPEAAANDWHLLFAFNIDVKSHFKYDDIDEDSSFTAYRRMLIPLYGPAGNLLSFEARATLPHEKLKSLFVRPVDFIFNYHILDKSKPLYLGEGFIEAARIYPYRSNVSHMFGTAVTDVKVELLKNFPEIILACDNDEAGYKLALDLQLRGLPIKIKAIPERFEDLGDRNLTNLDIGNWLRTAAVQMSNIELENRMSYWRSKKNAQCV